MTTKRNPLVFLDVAVGEKSAGRMIFELFSDAAPKTTEQFRAFCTGEKGPGLTGKSLYSKEAALHCVIDGPMAEVEDFSTGNNENFVLSHDGPGLLSTSNSSNSPQFLITFKSMPSLDEKHVVFGKIVEGHLTLKEIEDADIDGSSAPAPPVKIVSCGEVTDFGATAEASKLETLSKSKDFQSLFWDASYCNGDIEGQSSKLYGFPKRRKISAIRDFPPGCGLCTADVMSKGRLEISKDLLLQCESVLPEVGATDGTKVVKSLPLSCEEDEMSAEVCAAAVLSSMRKDSATSDVVQRSLDEESDKAARIREAEEKSEASAKSDEMNFHLQNDFQCLDDKHVFRSILYGPAKRRKISAVRNFPSGCGTSTTISDRKQLMEVTGSIMKSLDGDKKERTLLEGIRGAKETSIRNDFRQSPNRVLKVGSEKDGSTNNKRYMKENLAGSTSKSAGEGRPKNVVKKDHGFVAKKVERTGEVEERRHRRFDARELFERDELNSDLEDIRVKSVLRKSIGGKNGKIVKSQNKLPMEPDLVDVDALGEKVIVLGLMAEPNCPWRHGSRGLSISGRDTNTPIKKSRMVKKTKRENLPITSNQLEIAPIGNDDAQLNEDGRLLTDDEDEIGGASPVHLKLSVTAPLHGLVPLNSNTKMEGEEAARCRVRRTLRLFQAVCRKLLQEEESNVRGASKGKRIDIDAAKFLKERNECINTGKPVVGALPGVEIGDEFHFRIELSVIGLHRPYQAGIDFTKMGNKQLATSIVAGGNDDDMEGSDIMIYSGSGGSPAMGGKAAEDQKLERGNLSLKNSVEARNPVRVIRNIKETKIDPREGRTKIFSTYVYDGLYMVEKYWKEKVQQGYFGFKFQLRRVSGQPELPTKVIKKMGKSLSRPGICIQDISDGKEETPVSVVNTIDDERPPPFRYITKTKYPSSCAHAPPRGCDCTDGCSNYKKCTCAVKNGGKFPFTYSGQIVEEKSLVYECGPSCKCSATCRNRVSQHGLKTQLEVFKTESRGWGVRSLSSISSGSFVCEYVGELLPDGEVEQRSNDEYLFDIGKNYDDDDLCDSDSLANVAPHDQKTENVKDAGFTIDAARYGNIGRFINHSCSPNLFAQNVLFDHDDQRMPHIMLFAAENIPPLQELTYPYNYTIGQGKVKS